jgi:L-asparaginase
MAVKIFITGGTFDKEYDEIGGRLYFNDTHLPEILALGRCNLAISIRTLKMIDSLEMSDYDREVIVNNCKNCNEKQIVVTHGTDTMEITARVLGAANLGKTIILTGAMIPYKFGSSDGLFNLGTALAFVQSLPVGVYVAMNGKYFKWDNVKKNKSNGIFEALSS